ncbi:MAG TPA: LysM domain-containing protein [Methylotenera sp.]|jgi:LysM repeat protein
MNAGNNPNKAINTTTISKPEPILTAPLIEATPPTPTPASQFEINRHTGQTAPAQNRDSDTYLSEGKSTAITINTPFTVIPGLPALNKILAKIDKTTQQDLGFTFKASAAKIPNQQGEQDLQLTVDYIGFGLMSSKFNVQFSPVSIKVESGTPNPEPHWGCSASVLSSPMGLIHERAGVKGTFSDCNSTRTFSAAPEISYQSSKTFKPLSTATGGYFFGDKGTFRIPAEYVPTLERIKAASPDMEEWKMITDHIAPSIPALQIGRFIDQNIEVAGNAIKSVTSMAESVIDSTIVLKVDHTNNLTLSADTQSPTQLGVASVQDKNTNSTLTNIAISDSKPSALITNINTTQEDHGIKKQPIVRGIEPSIEEKANYTVALNDTLAMIGKKTGHPWTEIYALNKNILKNNPDKIYPGQELLIPDPHDHAALINHPVVQARIQANMAKQQALQTSEYMR